MFEGHKIFSDAKGYKIIWLDGKSVKLHVVAWERVHGRKPPGFEIHHIDFNKANYDASNLILLSASDHQKVHAGWTKTNGEWSHKRCSGCKNTLPLDDFYPRKGRAPSAKCKPCHNIQAMNWAKKNPIRKKEIALKYYYKNK